MINAGLEEDERVRTKTRVAMFRIWEITEQL